MKFYAKKGKLPGDDHPKAPNYAIIGVKMTWEQMISGFSKIAGWFKRKKDQS